MPSVNTGIEWRLLNMKTLPAFSSLAVLAFAFAPAAAQGTDWSAAFGVDVMAARYSQGAATSLSFNRRLGSVEHVGDVDIAFGWFRGSANYSMFSCHLARQEYCVGGYERLTAMNVGVVFNANSMGRLLGVDVTPVASVGLDRSKAEVSETEGPITMCFIGGEIVSCPDNPPFSQFNDVERAVLPFYSLGMDFSRRVGSVRVRTGFAACRAAWFDDEGHARLRFSVGLGF
jgi:hypothetical protein